MHFKRHSAHAKEGGGTEQDAANHITKQSRAVGPGGPTFMVSPWSIWRGMPLGSSVSAHGRTTTAGTPLPRTASSPASFQVSRPPSASLSLTAGGSCV